MGVLYLHIHWSASVTKMTLIITNQENALWQSILAIKSYPHRTSFLCPYCVQVLQTNVTNACTDLLSHRIASNLLHWLVPAHYYPSATRMSSVSRQTLCRSTVLLEISSVILWYERTCTDDFILMKNTLLKCNQGHFT